MKVSLTGFALISLLSSTLLCAPAKADNTIPQHQHAQILRLEMDRNFPAGDQYVEGSLDIDYAARTVRMMLIGESNCPEGAYCFVGPKIYSVELPITSISKDSCGVTVIQADKNLLPVDGDRKFMEIHDYANSHSHCQYFVAVPDTEITFKTWGSLFMAPGHSPAPATVSRIEASRLQ